MRDKLGRFVKGYHPSPETEFKKSHKQSNTGRTHFKKGMTSWIKGKHFSEEAKRNMSLAQKGNKSWRWKGGISNSPLGYIYILKPSHPFCSKCGYVKRANLVMEKHLGRYLIPPELVHHKNCIRDDDRIENLMLFPNRPEHTKFHFSKKIFGKISMAHRKVLQSFL